MLSTYCRTKVNRYASIAIMAVMAVLFMSSAHAQTVDVSNLSPETILTNISENALPNLMRLVTAISYVLGMVFIFRGVVKLKHVGEMRTQMSHEHNIATPIALIAVGALLLYLPSSVQIGMSSFWSDPSPYSYTENQDQWSQFINVCFMVVQFVGTVAFIRGLIILSHMSGGHQQGGLSKGLTHIIGGIFCINIYQFVQVVMATIGLGIQ